MPLGQHGGSSPLRATGKPANRLAHNADRNATTMNYTTVSREDIASALAALLSLTEDEDTNGDQLYINHIGGDEFELSAASKGCDHAYWFGDLSERQSEATTSLLIDWFDTCEEFDRENAEQAAGLGW